MAGRHPLQGTLAAFKSEQRAVYAVVEGQERDISAELSAIEDKLAAWEAAAATPAGDEPSSRKPRRPAVRRCIAALKTAPALSPARY